MAKVEPVIVSYSELDTFRQCPLKHHLLYDRRWTKPPKEGGALHKGGLWHLVMEGHYRFIKECQDQNKGKIPVGQRQAVLDTIWEQIVKPLLYDPQTGAQTETQELIEWMYHGYVQQYGVDPQWRIVGVEHQIVVPLLNEKGRASRYHLKMKLDLLVRDRETNDNLWVVDHKSGRDLPTKMDLDIDDQFGLYCWGCRRVGKRVQGAIHSANRTQRNKGPMTLESRMSRTYLARGDIELTNLALDAYFVARAAHPPKSQLPLRYSSPDPRQCGWKCDVKEPHLLMRTGRNPDEVMTEYGFTVNRTRH